MTALARNAVRPVEQTAHPRTGAVEPAAPLLGRRRAPIDHHQHEGEHDNEERRPLAIEELGVAGRGRMLVIGENAGRKMRLEGEHAHHDAARSSEVATRGNVVGEAPLGGRHQIDA